MLKEGRAALSTSFQSFKYMTSYSLIQFTSTFLLECSGTILGDFQYLWADLFLVMPLAFASEYTAAYKKLDRKFPVSSLISFDVIFSLVLINILNFSAQVGVLYFLKHQPWLFSFLYYHFLLLLLLLFKYYYYYYY